MPNTSIAFVGTVGVPNVYGGFESFLEVSVPVLVKRGHRVTVTCDASRYAEHDPTWRGAARIFIGIKANGAASVLHDTVAFFRVFRAHKNIVALGVSGGLFFPIFRLLCLLAGKNLIVNIDGVEWRRTKFSITKRFYLRVSDTLAQLCAHCVIIDNEGLYPYLTSIGRRKAVYIPYSGDHVIRLSCESTSKKSFLLTICRIEPENNCDLLLNAFKNLESGEYVFVGNWGASEYGRTLRTRFLNTPGLSLLDPIYDPKKLASMRESCVAYVHGHSVGGTNPSLVEMLFYDAPIAAYSCIFNKNTAGADADYFESVEDLTTLMRKYFGGMPPLKKKNRARFTCKAVVDAYEKVFN